MPISFASAPADFFNRLGKLGALIANQRSYQQTQLTAMTNTTTGVVAQFNAESDIQAQMGSAYIGLLGSGGYGGIAQQIAAATANRMVFRDQAIYGQTLTSANLVGSLYEIVRQMKVAGATVLAQTITLTPAAFIGSGNGVINSSAIRPLDGKVLENAYAEDVQFLCSNDSYLGDSLEGNEGFTVTGQGAETDLFAFDWPLGSNCSTAIAAIDANSDNNSGNLLTNSGYGDWTQNTPDNWQLVVGQPGVQVFEETGIVYDPVDGGKALRIVGDSSGTLTQLRQIFDDATGTTGTLSPLTQYSYNIMARRDGTAAGAGTLVIDWVDGNGVVLQDMNGAANTLSIDLTALTTVYTSYKAAFRTPHIMPEIVYLRMRLTVALTNGRAVYFDAGSLGQMTQLYVSGPFVAVHSGSIPFVAGDYVFLTVANSRGAAGTLNTWQTVWSLLYPVSMANEILLPSSATPNVGDALLT